MKIVEGKASIASKVTRLLPRSVRVVAAGAAALVGLAPLTAAMPVGADIVLDHVTIVDTHDGSLRSDMAVIVKQGRIASIVAARRLKPGAARVIDAHGKYLVPGYNDMHAHPLNEEGVDRLDELTLMLANGITGFRQMSGSAEMLAARHAGKLMPDAPAPALLALSGSVLIRPIAPTPAAGVVAVDQQKAQGADFIKVVDVSPDTFFAIGAEARKVGLPFLGHLPGGVDAVKAAQAGFQSIEHLGPFATILISCSTDETAIRAAMAARKPSGLPPMTPEQEMQALATAATEPVLFLAMDPDFFPTIDHVTATYSEAKCRGVAQAFIANGTWQSPTLIRDKTMDFGDDPQFVDDPNLRYVPGNRRAMWTMVAHRFSTTVTPAQKAVLARFWQVQQRMLRAFNEAGVSMIAGTDTGGQWEIPGFSLHQDFDLLAADGFAPLKVLQMTTLDPAKFLRRESEMGSVAEGRLADLVLLDADPTADARNLHKIAGVVRAGTFYSRQELAAMKETVAAHVRSAAGVPRS